MTPRNLSAYTPPGGSYPPFISINVVSDGVGFSIREPSPAPGIAGQSGHLVMEASIALRVLEEAAAKLRHTMGLNSPRKH